MADQNSTTTKHQQLEALRTQELLPDSDCIGVVAGYAAALSDALMWLDSDLLLSESHDKLKMIQYHLNMRVYELIAIESQRGAA